MQSSPPVRPHSVVLAARFASWLCLPFATEFSEAQRPPEKVDASIKLKRTSHACTAQCELHSANNGRLKPLMREPLCAIRVAQAE